IEAVTHQLTGQERSPALMICLTSRSGNVYKNTLEFIETVCQSPVACRLQLTKMPRDESTALIASVLDTREELIDEEIIAYVSENCFGNPFYIAQSAREWRDTSWFVNESGRWKLSSKESDRPQASSGMRDAIGQRLGRLSDSARQLASMGSVIGAIVDIDLLETICDSIDEFTFYNGLDELLASGVLREGLQTRHLNFTHDLFREAANAMLSQPRSERTHLKIAAELKERLDEGQEISSARLAEHFVSGGRPRQAWPYFLDAARRANNSQAFPDSVQILETANKAVPADADQRDQFEFKMLYGRALFEIGRVDAGRTQLDLAAKTAETGIQLANARWAIANSYPPMDNGDLVAKHLYEALRAIGEKPRISVLSRLSSIWISTMLMNLPKSLLRWFGGNNSRYALASKIYMDLSLASVGHDLLGYIQATSRNPVVATFSNDVDCITSAYSKYAINYAISGAIPSRFGRRFRRVARSKVKDCRSPFARAYALTHLGTSEYVDGNLHDAECLIREAIPFFERTRDWNNLYSLHMLRHSLSIEGDAKRILQTSQRELNFALKINDSIGIAWGKYGVANALCRMGNCNEAIALADDGVAATKGNPTHTIAIAERAYAHLQQSHFENARVDARESIRWMWKSRFAFDWSMMNYPCLADALTAPQWCSESANLTGKDRKLAAKACRKAVLCGWNFRSVRPYAFRVRGRYYSLIGKTSKARKWFLKAIAAAEAFEQQAEHARAMLDLSRLEIGSKADKLRGEGLENLRRLSTVLPIAEADALGITQTPYHEGKVEVDSNVTRPNQMPR
ncbi:MAG: hypothetical protein AB8B91_05310, partial [Rubripirellula sp.]